jgi:hypothetical protein
MKMERKRGREREMILHTGRYWKDNFGGALVVKMDPRLRLAMIGFRTYLL